MMPTIHDKNAVLVDRAAAEPEKKGDHRRPCAWQGQHRRQVPAGRGRRLGDEYNRDDPIWPRVFLGAQKADFTILGTVRLESIGERAEVKSIATKCNT